MKTLKINTSKKNETLLNEAKKLGGKNITNSNITDEQVELALGWARGQVSYIQVQRVMGLSPSTTYSFLAFSLKKYIQNNKYYL